MKALKGISVIAVLLAGAATPSFATTLAPGTVVSPGVVPLNTFNALANTAVTPFNFGGDTGNVQEYVANWGGNPFGAGDISFIYEIQVTGGNILNLTTESFAIPGISLDVQQVDLYLSAGLTSGTLTPAQTASLTSDGTTVGFGFAPPDGLMPGMTSYTLFINTNLTSFESGVFSLQDGQTQNFAGFVPVASTTPEPSSLALLGTTLLGAAGLARRRLLNK